MSAQSILMKAIKLGKQGRFKIAPENLSISATENCNLECIMCPGHTGNTGARISIDEAKALFQSLADKDVSWGRPKTLDMTAGEPLLNSNLACIYRSFKELFPGATISMISNATLPITGQTLEAFQLTDRIGLSMDGATKETFERIRRKSNYENVIRNIKNLAIYKKQGTNCKSLQILYVVMDQNIHELPEMVRLTHALGIPGLFAQVAEKRGGPFNYNGQNVSLNMSNREAAPYLIEAKNEARRLGVDLSLTSQLEDVLRESSSFKKAEIIEVDSRNSSPNLGEDIKYCSYPWLYAPRIVQNVNKDLYPTTVCCHMPQQDLRGNLRARSEFVNQSIGNIFNSDFYWNLRVGLLDGSLAKDACKDCQYYRMTQWTYEQLMELELAINEVESLSERLSLYPPNIELIESKYGRLLFPLRDEGHGRTIEESEGPGDEEVELFAHLIKPGSIAIDIGASIGKFSVVLAQIVGPEGVVVAFEPEPTLHKILCANIVLNSIPNVITYAMTLGSHEGESKIPVFNPTSHTDFWGRKMGNAEEVVLVPVGRLDDFQLERVDFIRLATESPISAVLEGARETIQRCDPVIYIKQRIGENLENLIQGLSDLDYRLWWHTFPFPNTEGNNGSSGSTPEGETVLVIAIHRDQTPIERLQQIVATWIPGRPLDNSYSNNLI